jgi:hypothetical protein
VEERDLKMHIEMGDDGQYSATGISTITFQRKSGKPFQLKYAMHVPSPKKSLVSVTMLEDRGYRIVFSGGKDFL